MEQGKNIFASLITFNKMILSQSITAGAIVCDATLGNGHDALFLAEITGSRGTVIGFDIQPEAIEVSTKRMQEAGFDNFSFYLESHSAIDQYLSEADAVVFNLGYLPGHAKEVVTQPETTLEAIEKSLKMLKKNGLISIMFYVGHPGGLEEKEYIMPFIKKLDKHTYDVLEVTHANRSETAPFLLLLYKKGD